MIDDNIDANEAGANESRTAGNFDKTEAEGYIEKRWYVVHTYSGFENHVKLSLEERIASSGLKKYFGDILVPTEMVIEKGAKGNKKAMPRKFFPGYIFVNMNINNESWHLLKGTPKVTGFVGDQLNPQPVEEGEIEKIISQVSEGIKKPKSKVQFSKGDNVKIIDGAFAGFNGIIDEVKADKNRLEVLVSIFGRATPVELDFIQVERN